jgi:hypothetical protein
VVRVGLAPGGDRLACGDSGYEWCQMELSRGEGSEVPRCVLRQQRMQATHSKSNGLNLKRRRGLAGNVSFGDALTHDHYLLLLLIYCS